MDSIKYYDISVLKRMKSKGFVLNNFALRILDLFGDCEGPIPPVQHAGQARHYWLQFVDGDGRYSGFPIVLAWQPTVKKWCLPNAQATGEYFNAEDYVILGEAVIPDSDNYYRQSLGLI